MQVSYFKELFIPNELKLNIISTNLGAISVTDKKSAFLANNWFEKANQRITNEFSFLAKKYPSFKEILSNNNNNNNYNASPKKIFMRLVNCLHNEAGNLDTQAPKGLNPLERLTWECNHYTKLFEKIRLPEEKIFNLLFTDLKKFDYRYAKNVIHACYLLWLKKDEFIAYASKKNDVEFTKKSGLNVNMEKPIEDLIAMIESIPAQMLKNYQQSKRENKLEVFFECLNQDKDSLEKIINFLAEFNISFDQSALRKFIILQLPIVLKNRSKMQNLDTFRAFFEERQLRRYAYEKNIKIDEKWEFTKIDILHSADFTTDYCHKAQFVKFLKEDIQIIGKETSNGPFLDTELDRVSHVHSYPDS